MNATDFLKSQHREVEQLFKTIETSSGVTKTNLVKELAANLAAHMRIEEELVYPLAKEFDEDGEMEAMEEHNVAAYTIKRLAGVGIDDATADAKLKVLKDLIAHHVKEEETMLLPKLERGIGPARNEALGVQCKKRFDEIKATGYGGALFDKPTRTTKNGKDAKGKNAKDGEGAGLLSR